MFQKVDIQTQLEIARKRTRRAEDMLISEANRILRSDLFAEKKILGNLKQYSRSFDVLDEEDIDQSLVFTLEEIRRVAIEHRLKFLETRQFSQEVPYEAMLKIKELDRKHGKDLIAFRILASPQRFNAKDRTSQCSLFVKTNADNWYLIHQWGQPLSWKRRILFWPFRSFEKLALTVMLFTFIVTMSLPTNLITLDSKATYWCGYRAAAFFHLLIFDFGVTVYFTFAFALNFSSSVWNKKRDFD